MRRGRLGPLGVQEVEVQPSGVGVGVDHRRARREGDRRDEELEMRGAAGGDVDGDDRLVGVVGRGDDLARDADGREAPDK